MIAYLEGVAQTQRGCMFYVDPKGTGRITFTPARRPNPEQGIYATATDAFDASEKLGTRRRRWKDTP